MRSPVDRRFSDVVSHASEQSSESVSLPVQLLLRGAGLFERAESNGLLGPAECRLRFCAEFCSDLTFANQVLHDFRVRKEEPYKGTRNARGKASLLTVVF
jgi:hypothetical protein